MVNQNLISSSDLSEEENLSEKEALILQNKLWKLLKHHTELYTAGDSSSVSVETAQELITSICFTMDTYRKENHLSLKQMVTRDWDKIFQEAVNIIQEKIEQGKREYQAVCLNIPALQNDFLYDTLKNIGNFFKQYDFYFFAHQIPCSIDYILCNPVPDDFLGIVYIREYLRRLKMENNFLRQFDIAKERGLLHSYCPDYNGLLINLYEPILTNAVGLTLIKEDVTTLNISQEGQVLLAEKFTCRTDMQIRQMLEESVETLCHHFQAVSIDAQEYMVQAAEKWVPRIKAALMGGELDNIFLKWADS